MQSSFPGAGRTGCRIVASGGWVWIVLLVIGQSASARAAVAGATGASKGAGVISEPGMGVGGARTNSEAATLAEAWMIRARSSQQRGLLKQAVEFVAKAVDLMPMDPKPVHYRAFLQERMRNLAGAEVDYSKAIELAPGEAALWSERALVRLRLADFAGSVADFDRFAELSPSKLPMLWQRGIALFYAGRYEDGRRQFELHRTVNPQDVENSVWHFCCVARQEGFGAARALLLPVTADVRVPMAEIQALFAGKAEPEAVMRAAEAARPERRREEAVFYGELYLALYFGAAGKREDEVRHAAEAARLGKEFGIMGEIAQLHANWVAVEMRKTGR